MVCSVCGVGNQHLRAREARRHCPFSRLLLEVAHHEQLRIIQRARINEQCRVVLLQQFIAPMHNHGVCFAQADEFLEVIER